MTAIVYGKPVSPLHEEAANVCEQTARWRAGGRDELRTPMANPDDPEFSDEAFGLAAAVAMAVGKALRDRNVWPGEVQVWNTAAQMLRTGYELGQRVVVYEPGVPS